MAVFKSCAFGMIFNCIGEPVFSYVYYLVILKNAQKAITYLAFAKFVTTFVNAVLAVIIASLIYLSLYPRLKESGLLDKVSSEE